MRSRFWSSAPVSEPLVLAPAYIDFVIDMLLTITCELIGMLRCRSRCKWVHALAKGTTAL